MNFFTDRVSREYGAKGRTYNIFCCYVFYVFQCYSTLSFEWGTLLPNKKEKKIIFFGLLYRIIDHMCDEVISFVDDCLNSRGHRLVFDFHFQLYNIQSTHLLRKNSANSEKIANCLYSKNIL